MRTYRELCRSPEFLALFGGSSAQVAATTLTGIALATLVDDRTDSPLLSALAVASIAVTVALGPGLRLSEPGRTDRATQHRVGSQTARQKESING
ncbi:hypothetical protein [Fodinicola acaciae]|uniref:hypothetical protein n=1 Tax=Fodinicola acaciae TaxID=2681555 RepID=UPI0013D01C95|nr:hypothetical protein [Fodinicola acaciae]